MHHSNKYLKLHVKIKFKKNGNTKGLWLPYKAARSIQTSGLVETERARGLPKYDYMYFPIK